MSTDLRYAGLHFCSNHTPPARLFDLLVGRATVMLHGEAKWHLARVREHPETLVIYRGVPDPGKRPAEISANGYTDALLEQVEYCRSVYGYTSLGAAAGDYTWGNEPELEYEMGGPFPGFGPMAVYYDAVMARLRAAGITRLWWPGWTPDKGDLDHLDDWKWAAEKCVGLLIHAYGEPDDIVARCQNYLDLFRDKLILLAETHTARWSGDHEGARDPSRNVALLAGLRQLALDNSRFVGACRFTWKWGPPADGWTPAYDVEGRDDLEAMYADPERAIFEGGFLPAPTPEPVVPVPVPTPVPPLPPPPPPPPDERIPPVQREALRLIAERQAAGLEALPPRLLLALGWAESTWTQDAERWGKRTKEALQAIEVLRQAGELP